MLQCNIAAVCYPHRAGKHSWDVAKATYKGVYCRRFAQSVFRLSALLRKHLSLMASRFGFGVIGIEPSIETGSRHLAKRR